MSSRVTVQYPFHPHHGQALAVIQRPRRREAAVTVLDPASAPLQIPAWMLSTQAAGYGLSDHAAIASPALLRLADLLHKQLTAPSGPV